MKDNEYDDDIIIIIIIIVIKLIYIKITMTCSSIRDLRFVA